MVKILLPFLFAFFVINAFGQEEYDYQTDADTIAIPHDGVVFNLFSSMWPDAPAKMDIKPVNMGAEFYVMSNIVGDKSKFAIATGAGFSFSNIYSNALPVYSNLRDSVSFLPIPDSISYKSNKFTTVYVDVPLEFRFRTVPKYKNRNFKFALGVRGGYLINSFVKYKGDEYENGIKREVKYKKYKIDNLLKYRYGAYARVGYGKINFIVNYTLSTLFEKNKGPEINPLTVGLSFVFL